MHELHDRHPAHQPVQVTPQEADNHNAVSSDLQEIKDEFVALTGGTNTMSFDQSLGFSFCAEWLHHQDLTYEQLQEAWNESSELDADGKLSFEVGRNWNKTPMDICNRLHGVVFLGLLSASRTTGRSLQGG